MQSVVGWEPQSAYCYLRSDRAAETSTAEISRGFETILLVEDDAAVRQAVMHGLGQERYRVLAAANGHKAIERFAKYADELAIAVTDLVMPEMGGIGLGERLRESGAAIPIVYATGYHEDLESIPLRNCRFVAASF